MKIVSVFAFLVLCASARAQYVLRTLDQRWEGICLVAVVEVGPVTEVSTPQGLLLQSETAKIKQLVYRRFKPLEGESADDITIYSFMPSGLEVACPAPLTLKSGPAFVMMAMQGMNKFYPSDPWEFQPLEKDFLLWPAAKGIEERSLKDVIAEISAYAAKHPHQN